MMYRKLLPYSIGLFTLSLSCGLAWGQLAVTGMTLINADTDSPVAAHDPLVDGATVNLLEVGTSLNIRADVSGSPGSVRFGYDGNANFRTENTAPYALAGDNQGDYNSWTPTLGGHTVTATPYPQSGAGGTAGTPLTISFTAVEQAGNQPPDVDAGPDQALLWPSNNTVLVGSATDTDGTVVDVHWTQQSGPGMATLSGTNTTTLTVSDLGLGSYLFRLAATDEDGDSAFDEASVYVSTGGTVAVTGELKKWHNVTLTFDGPVMSETGSPNPFMDRRLDVRFSHAGSGKMYVVPGYFAADGQAADTGAESGDQWRVHFAPDETGEWTWLASFRQGTDVAVDTNLTAGTSAGFMDGTIGAFTIAPTDKTGRDHRGKGRLDVVGRHHLRYGETGRYFLKCGADAPENLFAYDDFDGTPNVNNRRKSWQPHQQDYDAADAAVYTWESGKGTELLGAIRYLADKGMNAFSFLTFNVDGDDDNVFAHRLTGTTAQYEALADNTRWANNGVYKDRMDVSKLGQWERVFSYGDKLGMYLHFKTMETENELKMDGGDLGRERKVYYRELIARFGHHLALNWNLGEEINNASTAQKKAWAEYLWAVDPYHHNIVIHNGANHYDLMGPGSKLTGFSLQTNQDDFRNVHGSTLNYINRSVDAGKPWVVACDEPGDAQHALVPDTDLVPTDPDRINSRRNALWGHLMAGGAGLEFYFGYAHAQSDLTCEDWRSRDLFWPLGKIALDFFNKYTPFWLMTNRNDLIGNAANDITQGFCLAKAGEVYVVFLPTGGAKTLDLSGAPGRYLVRWYDPRNGGSLQIGPVSRIDGGGSVSIGMPPADTGNDWAALVLRADADGDEDGLVDFWELTYFDGIDVSAGGSNDQDGDRFIDSDEQGAGTNPADSNSLLRVTSILPAGSEAIIQWPTVAGRTYDIAGSTDLSSNWTAVVTGLPAAANSYTVDTGTAWQDFRIEVY